MEKNVEESKIEMGEKVQGIRLIWFTPDLALNRSLYSGC